jgi:hypothetical protein
MEVKKMKAYATVILYDDIGSSTKVEVLITNIKNQYKIYTTIGGKNPVEVQTYKNLKTIKDVVKYIKSTLAPTAKEGIIKYY